MIKSNEIYICIKEFWIATIDEDGYSNENKLMHIRKGSKWKIAEEQDGEYEIKLEHVKNNSWLGITKKELYRNFRKLGE